jgi:hypothetical protein
MIEMVNGYPCANCTDVSNARRGLNPENPTSDPVKQEQLDREAGRVMEPAVTYGGSLAAYHPAEARPPPSTCHCPPATAPCRRPRSGSSTSASDAGRQAGCFQRSMR